LGQKGGSCMVLLLLLFFDLIPLSTTLFPLLIAFPHGS
jgi:hypothetical protein